MLSSVLLRELSYHGYDMFHRFLVEAEIGIASEPAIAKELGFNKTQKAGTRGSACDLHYFRF